MNKKRLMLVMFALLALGGAVGGWWFSQPFPLLHPEEGSNIAHAAPGEVEGCAVCHLSAIPYTNCSDCHDAPSSTVGNNVYLKHHINPDGCEVCHENPAEPDDARYVLIPESSHAFCLSCHNKPGYN